VFTCKKSLYKDIVYIGFKKKNKKVEESESLIFCL
jgi:hypothetical protein